MSNSDQDDRVFYSSVVLEHVVPNENKAAFRKWHSNLINSAEQHQGFVREDVCPPLQCIDGVFKSYSIVHFDTPNHLNDWLNSDDREALIKSGAEIFENYKFKSFTTGLEGWFSTQSGQARSSLGPPSWKQIMSVVLGLYPLVVIQTKLFSTIGFLDSLPSESVMLLSNFITSSLLTWVVMPRITRLFKFWLQPAFRASEPQIDLIGAAIVLVALGLMMAIFIQI